MLKPSKVMGLLSLGMTTGVFDRETKLVSWARVGGTAAAKIDNIKALQDRMADKIKSNFSRRIVTSSTMNN